MRPHDLLWLRTAPSADGMPLPTWVETGWPVVVRRAQPAGSELIPVGLRGRLRHQRHPAWVARAQVLRTCSPEALARARSWTRMVSDGLPCIETLARLAPIVDAAGLRWGPTGSVGFALASGESALHSASDLDLLVRAEIPLDDDEVDLLRQLKTHASCRLDIQIDTGRGGFALDEWLAGRRRVLLKTASGPRLVADPWQPETEECSS